MPAQAKTSDAEIVRAAKELIAQDGAAALSMQAVADVVGLRAPSLYKRFPDRAALLLAVERQVLDELSRALARGFDEPHPLEAAAHAYRRFARRHRHLYELLFSGATRDDAEATELRRRVAAPMIDHFARSLPAKEALAAARVLTAFLHGFVSMENAREFRLGPDVDAAFARGVRTLVRG
jgi:AcrR family transcriptional regulator